MTHRLMAVVRSSASLLLLLLLALTLLAQSSAAQEPDACSSNSYCDGCTYTSACTWCYSNGYDAAGKCVASGGAACGADYPYDAGTDDRCAKDATGIIAIIGIVAGSLAGLACFVATAYTARWCYINRHSGSSVAVAVAPPLSDDVQPPLPPKQQQTPQPKPQPTPHKKDDKQLHPPTMVAGFSDHSLNTDGTYNDEEPSAWRSSTLAPAPGASRTTTSVFSIAAPESRSSAPTHSYGRYA